MAMLFPWTYYFANRKFPRSFQQPSSTVSSLSDDEFSSDEIWPYPNLVNATLDEVGSGEAFDNFTSTLPPVLIESSGWEVNFWIHGVIMPLIAIFGILANFVSFVVLTRRAMRTAVINTYLAALSAFDGVLLLIALFLYPPMAYCEYSYGSDATCSICQYFFRSALITYPLSLIAQSGSVWTLTAITVDRLIAITWPVASRRWCTNRRALIVSLVILAWSIIYNIPSFLELKLVQYPSEFDENGKTSSFVTVLDRTEMRKDATYVRAYKGYCYFIFMLFIPVGTMIVLYAYVTVSVRRASRVRRRSINVSNSGRDDKERRCTLMAVLVVGTFLLLNSLAFVNNIREGFRSEDELSKLNFLTLVCIGNVLVALKSAGNFFIYYALGLRFRQMLCKIFCPCCYTPEREYQFLSVYYGSGRNYCWTNGGGPREHAAGDESGALIGGGIISMKTLPSIRRPNDRDRARHGNKFDISVPVSACSPGGRSSVVNVNRRSPVTQSATGTRISPPIDASNLRTFQQQQPSTNVTRADVSQQNRNQNSRRPERL